jgi:hypothetical protein
MKHFGIFILGSGILFPLVYVLIFCGIACKILALICLIVVVFSGDKYDKSFWKSYFSILFPLPKEYDN